MADEAERQSDVEEETVEETVEAVEEEETVEAAVEEEETVEAAIEEEDFIRVAGSEDGDPMEFPKEADNTVTFSTVQAQFPKATGLKYRSASGAWRAIRDVDNVLAAPKEGWGNTLYIISVPDDAEEENSDTRKRKAETEPAGESKAKQPKEPVDIDEEKLTQDMPVTNLPYAVTEKELREYFTENYGELAYCQLKTERGSNKSRGFGFIRFKDADTAKDALNNSHTLHGRTFYVKQKIDKPMKLFVGRLPNDITKEEMEEYFSQFGKVEDIFLTKPFKNIGFVTYANSSDAKKVLRMDHSLKGKTLNIEEGRPVDQQGGPRGGAGGRGGGQSSSRHGGGGGGGGRYGRGGYNQPQQNYNNNYGGGQAGGNALEQGLTSLLLNYLGAAAGGGGGGGGGARY